MTGAETAYTIVALFSLAAVMAGLSALKNALKRYLANSCGGRSAE